VDRGFEVVGVDMAPGAHRGVTVAQVPAAADPAFLDRLTAIARSADIDLIVPTVTEELLVLAGAGARGDLPPIVVAPFAAVDVANDKLLTCRHLTASRVAVPRFSLARDLDTVDDVAHVLGLPYLSKPRVGRGGRGTTVHHDVAPEHLSAPDDALILQEFIPGTEYAPNLYLAEDPADDIVIVLEKTLLAHGEIGNALAAERVVADDVAIVARRAARAVGLTGPVDLDVRRRADGTPVVLEINARFGANSAHAPEVLDQLLAEHLARLAVPA
jgi:carbamoylphosphate synthase large subunit